MEKFPQWATPDRQAFLVELFIQSKGFCVYGHNPCPHPLEHCYEVASEDMIKGWQEDDRILRSIQWEQEKRRLHALSTIWRRGPFDSIAREEYLAKRPIWRIVGIGVGAFTQQRVALVELPGLFKQTIWVNLAGLKMEGSKNKLRKLARYRRGSLPKGLISQAKTRINAQVQELLG